MKLSESLTLAALGMGCPLLIFGSTLYGSASCQLNKQAGVILPLGRKSDAYALLLLAGAAQGGLAGWLGYRIFKKEQAEEHPNAPTFSSRRPTGSLPPTPTQTIEVPASQPQRELVNLGEAKLEASSETEAIYTIPSQPRSKAQEIVVDDQYHWFFDLLEYPVFLVWGPQGSGKTSFVACLSHHKRKRGHQVQVWDPHKKYGQWEGLTVHGTGMDYEAIDRQMVSFERSVKRNYLERSENPHYQPVKETVVCEEFTNWAERCEHSGEFFKAALSDIRKIGKCVTFVAHDRTLSALGGAKGVAKARDAGLLELELEAKVDPVTGEAVPALRGKLKYPGKEAIPVSIAPWMKGEMNFKESTQEVTLSQPEQHPTPQQVWNRLILESDPETINRFIEKHRKKPDTESDSVSDSVSEQEVNETEENFVSDSDKSADEGSTLRISADTVSEYFPELSCNQVFELIEKGYEIRLSPSDIVKKQLKMTNPDRYSIGKAICVYLVRTYGSTDLILHFRKWIES